MADIIAPACKERKTEVHAYVNHFVGSGKEADIRNIIGRQ
jgi:hypothetical protein